MQVDVARDQGNELLRSIAKRTHPLTLEEERELAREIKAGSPGALDRLLRAHLRLVLSMARELARGSSNIDDLISEGFLGLLLAAKRFDPERGRFATYAAYWIRACINRYRQRTQRIVCTPTTRNARVLVSQLPRFSRAHLQRHGQEPDAAAIAQAFELDICEARELIASLSGRDLSYDAPECELAADDLSPEARVADAEVAAFASERVRFAVAQLPDREREIIERRHLADEAMSLREVGRAYGISGERVRQIDSKACERLRELLS